MAKNKKQENPLRDQTTQYGEFISSFDNWTLPQKQKKKAEKLEEKIGK